MLTDLPRRLLRVVPRVACGLALTSLLDGCGTLYVAQAAQGQFQVLAARRPIERVIADPRTPPALRARLGEVRDIRRFAVQALGLPDNGSYRSYADIGRPYVVWNVVATPEFSVTPLHWCFPVAGCVSYRGYFKEALAEAFARGLRARGDDAFVGGVPAYSTLGRFADPLLSTVINYPDADVAAIIFHELAHQLLYVPGDSQFNESFAETVEEAGLARWLAAGGRAAELARFERRRSEEQAFVAVFVRGRERLRALYLEPLPAGVMRARKADVLADIAAQVRTLEGELGVHSGYDDWLEAGLDNARLASVGTYFDCVPGFERLLASEGDDLPRFYAAVRALARRPRAERDALCTA